MRSHFRRVTSLAVALLFGCVWTVSVHAIEKGSSYQAALESIKAEELGAQVGYLASSALEGREAGTRGGRAAADYLVDQYARLHLRGAGVQGNFFQPFAPNFRNILVILPGGDPKFRDQVIVVGAHYDHVGYGQNGLSRGPSGYIHPGADDNASGTATVLELAKAFTILSAPPKRSIVFAAWDAEEKGLLGSKYWLAHPTLPLERVTAAVNLDMVGRLRDEHLIVFGVRSGYGWRRLLSSQNDEAGLQLDFSWTLKPNADHYSFFDHGIPVLMAHTGLHDDYHRPSDVANRINSTGMARVTRLLFAMLYELADRPAAVPGFRAAARHETPDTEKALLEQSEKPADRLGVGWSEDAAVVGGVKVSVVTAGSPADRAGVRQGDCIVRFAGRDIHSDNDFFAAVYTAESPASLTLRRPGASKPLQLHLELPGSPLRWGLAWRVDDAEPGVVILTHVVAGTPAARADLRGGDRIYQVGGRDFADETGFLRATKSLTERLPLLVERNGRLRTVVLQSRQAETLRRAA
jgi:hypothetical protein